MEKPFYASIMQTILLEKLKIDHRLISNISFLSTSIDFVYSCKLFFYGQRQKNSRETRKITFQFHNLLDFRAASCRE